MPGFLEEFDSVAVTYGLGPRREALGTDEQEEERRRQATERARAYKPPASFLDEIDSQIGPPDPGESPETKMDRLTGRTAVQAALTDLPRDKPQLGPTANDQLLAKAEYAAAPILAREANEKAERVARDAAKRGQASLDRKAEEAKRNLSILAPPKDADRSYVGKTLGAAWDTFADQAKKGEFMTGAILAGLQTPTNLARELATGEVDVNEIAKRDGFMGRAHRAAIQAMESPLGWVNPALPSAADAVGAPGGTRPYDPNADDMRRRIGVLGADFATDPMNLVPAKGVTGGLKAAGAGDDVARAIGNLFGGPVFGDAPAPRSPFIGHVEKDVPRDLHPHRTALEKTLPEAQELPVHPDVLAKKQAAAKVRAATTQQELQDAIPDEAVEQAQMDVAARQAPMPFEARVDAATLPVEIRKLVGDVEAAAKKPPARPTTRESVPLLGPEPLSPAEATRMLEPRGGIVDPTAPQSRGQIELPESIRQALEIEDIARRKSQAGAIGGDDLEHAPDILPPRSIELPWSRKAGTEAPVAVQPKPTPAVLPFDPAASSTERAGERFDTQRVRAIDSVDPTGAREGFQTSAVPVVEQGPYPAAKAGADQALAAGAVSKERTPKRPPKPSEPFRLTEEKHRLGYDAQGNVTAESAKVYGTTLVDHMMDAQRRGFAGKKDAYLGGFPDARKFPPEVADAAWKEAERRLASKGQRGSVLAGLPGAVTGAAIGGAVGGIPGAVVGGAMGALAAHVDWAPIVKSLPEASKRSFARMAEASRDAASKFDGGLRVFPKLQKYQMGPDSTIEARATRDQKHLDALPTIAQMDIHSVLAKSKATPAELELSRKILVDLDEMASIQQALNAGEPPPKVPSGRPLGSIAYDLQRRQAQITPGVQGLLDEYRRLDDEAGDQLVQAGQLDPQHRRQDHVFRVNLDKMDLDGRPVSTGPGSILPAVEKQAKAAKRRRGGVYEQADPWESLWLGRVEAERAAINHKYAMDVSKQYGTPPDAIMMRASRGEPLLAEGEKLYSFDPHGDVIQGEAGVRFLSAWKGSVDGILNSLTAAFGQPAALQNPQFRKAMESVQGRLGAHGHFELAGNKYAVLPGELADALQDERASRVSWAEPIHDVLTKAKAPAVMAFTYYSPGYWLAQATYDLGSWLSTVPPQNWGTLAKKTASVMLKTIMAEFTESVRGEVSQFYQEARRGGYQTSGMLTTDPGAVAPYEIFPWQHRTPTQKAQTVLGAANPLSHRFIGMRILDALVGRTRETVFRKGAGETLEQMGASPLRASTRANQRMIDFQRRGKMGRALGPLSMFYKAAVELFNNHLARSTEDPTTGKNLKLRGLYTTLAPIAAIAGALAIDRLRKPDLYAKLPKKAQNDLTIAWEAGEDKNFGVDEANGEKEDDIIVLTIPTNFGELKQQGEAIWDLLHGKGGKAWTYFARKTHPWPRAAFEGVSGRKADEPWRDILPWRYQGVSEEERRRRSAAEGGPDMDPEEAYFKRNYPVFPWDRYAAKRPQSTSEMEMRQYGIRISRYSAKGRLLEEGYESKAELFARAWDLRNEPLTNQNKAALEKEIDRLGLRRDWYYFKKEQRSKDRSVGRGPVNRQRAREGRIPDEEEDATPAPRTF